MKLLLTNILLLLSLNSLASVASVFQGNPISPFEAFGLCKNHLADSNSYCAFVSTTSLPTIIFGDMNDVEKDDAMVQLADEVTGELDSTVMIEKMAAHFETTPELIIEASSSLLETEEGLSFDGLKEQLK